MKTSLALLIFLLTCLRPATAGEYSTNFNNFNLSGQVAGQDGWTIDDESVDLSFVVVYNQSGRAAAMGGKFSSLAGSSAAISHEVGIPFAQSSFSSQIAILPSGPKFPGRDTFGWTLSDPSSASLFSIKFVPSSNNPDLLDIVWSTGNGPVNATGWAVFYNAPYFMDLDFRTAVGGAVSFTATITGTTAFSFGGSLPGVGDKTLQKISANFIAAAAAAGDNVFIFDDVAALIVPPAPDVDGDGFDSQAEAWFGTSDNNGAAFPVVTATLTGNTVSLTFPSVAGNSYQLGTSVDLGIWELETILATSASTTVTRPVLNIEPLRRYYRVSRP